MHARRAPTWACQTRQQVGVLITMQPSSWIVGAPGAFVVCLLQWRQAQRQHYLNWRFGSAAPGLYAVLGYTAASSSGAQMATALGMPTSLSLRLAVLVVTLIADEGARKVVGATDAWMSLQGAVIGVAAASVHAICKLS